MKDGAGALLFAARNGHLDIIKLLTENGMNVTNAPDALNWAAKKNGELSFRYTYFK